MLIKVIVNDDDDFSLMRRKKSFKYWNTSWLESEHVYRSIFHFILSKRKKNGLQNTFLIFKKIMTLEKLTSKYPYYSVEKCCFLSKNLSFANHVIDSKMK